MKKTRLELLLIEKINEANTKWNLFSEGEKIILGISGGKDSLALLNLMMNFPVKIYPLHIQIFDEIRGLSEYVNQFTSFSTIKADYLNKLNQLKKNHCFTCTRGRRKQILEYADKHKINKIMFGHHKSDAVETLLMNMIYSREISTMTPKQDLFGGQFHIIRPMYLIDEKLLIKYSKEKNIPELKEVCPFSKDTKRASTKKILDQLQVKNLKIDITDNIFASMKHIKANFLPKIK